MHLTFILKRNVYMFCEKGCTSTTGVTLQQHLLTSDQVSDPSTKCQNRVEDYAFDSKILSFGTTESEIPNTGFEISC